MRPAIAVLLFVTAAMAQNPPGIDWREIRSPHFRVLFPHDLESDANRAANELETFYGPMSGSFGVHPKPATVIFDNQGPTGSVGGYVTLWPFRAVWYTPPSQGTIGTNRWLTLMSAHEGRHLIQFRALNRGFTRAATALFGDNGLSFMETWGIPRWWLEGDAAVAETAFTGGGQQRLPGASLLMRANMLSGRRFSYMKAVHGSYRDAVPDAYSLGALMISRVNHSGGTEAWNRILRDWTRQSWNPFALSRAMHKETGRGVSATYADVISETNELWTAKADAVPHTKARVLNRASKSVWTSYSFPVYDSDGAVLAQKAGMNDYPLALIRLHSDGSEETVFHYAPSGVARLSVAAGKIVWQENIPDPRWQRGWTRIILRDLQTGHIRQFARGGRVESPTLSPDGSRIAAVEFTAASICSLVILDAVTGQEQRFPAGQGEYLFAPAWSADGRTLAIVRQTATGTKALSLLHLPSGAFDELIAPSHEDLSYPVFAGDYVLYNSSFNGIDNIYAVHTATKARFQVTSARLAALYPAVTADGRKLLYSECGALGLDVAEMDLQPSAWLPIEAVQSADIHYHETNAHDYTTEVPATLFPSRPYHRVAHLIDVHSWGVTSPPPHLGFGIHSTDKMGLLDFTAGMQYDWNERTTGYDLSGSFSGLYPILDFGLSRTAREVRFPTYKSKWAERAARVGFHIPWNLSRGLYSTWLVAGGNIETRRIGAGSLLPLDYWVSFDRYRQLAARDLGPTWGQSLFLSYQHTPWNSDYHGDLISAIASVYVPSPVRNHAIRVEVGNERRDPGNYYFSSQMIFPRGYDSVVSRSFWKGSANYSLPVAYPEFALKEVAYLKRVTANFFYDYGQSAELLYRSAGAEAIFEFHALAILTPLRIGVRYSYRFDASHSRVEPFLAFTW